MNIKDLWVGLSVIWIHKPREGYGYVMPITVNIHKINKKSVSILVPRKDGNVSIRNVSPDSLIDLSKSPMIGYISTKLKYI